MSKHAITGTITWIGDLHEGNILGKQFRYVDAVIMEPAPNDAEYQNALNIRAQESVVDQLLALKLIPDEERRQLFTAEYHSSVFRRQAPDGKYYPNNGIYCHRLTPNSTD